MGKQVSPRSLNRPECIIHLLSHKTGKNHDHKINASKYFQLSSTPSHIILRSWE